MLVIIRTLEGLHTRRFVRFNGPAMGLQLKQAFPGPVYYNSKISGTAETPQTPVHRSIEVDPIFS